jgi:hypothetical protein
MAVEYTLLSLTRERRFSVKALYPSTFHLQQCHPMYQIPEKDTNRWRVTIQWLLIQLRSDLHTLESLLIVGFLLLPSPIQVWMNYIADERK